MSHLLAEATMRFAEDLCANDKFRDGVNAVGPTVAGLAVGTVNPAAGQLTRAALSASAKAAPDGTAQFLTAVGLSAVGTVAPIVVLPFAAAAGVGYVTYKAIEWVWDIFE